MLIKPILGEEGEILGNLNNKKEFLIEECLSNKIYNSDFPIAV